jgi:dipeptidyl-peptidase-4
MRRLLTLIALLGIVATATAQVSYLDMARERAEHYNYVAPGSLTPVDGTHKYMEIIGNKVVLFDYDKVTDGEVVFTADHPIISYEKSPNGELALYEMYVDTWPRQDIYRHSYTSTYYVTCPDQQTARIEDIRDVTFSPDSKFLAMSYNNDLFLYDLFLDKLYSITNDGEWNHIINGTTDWVYEEEYGFTQAYVFSPDSREIAYLKFDESAVPEFEMMRFDATLYNKAYSFKYPKAGDKNSIVTLHVYNIESGETRQIPVGE